MTQVGEVLHLPGGVAPPAVRAGRDHRPAAILQFRHLRQRPARLFDGYPHQAVTLLAAIRRDPGLGRHPGRVLQLRNGHAPAVGPVPPAVVGADELIAGDPAQRQRGAAVHAHIRMGAWPAIQAAPQDQRLAEQVGLGRLVGQVPAERDRMPARSQGADISERPRGSHGAAALWRLSCCGSLCCCHRCCRLLGYRPPVRGAKGHLPRVAAQVKRPGAGPWRPAPGLAQADHILGRASAASFSSALRLWIVPTAIRT